MMAIVYNTTASILRKVSLMVNAIWLKLDSPFRMSFKPQSNHRYEISNNTTRADALLTWPHTWQPSRSCARHHWP